MHSQSREADIHWDSQDEPMASSGSAELLLSSASLGEVKTNSQELAEQLGVTSTVLCLSRCRRGKINGARKKLSKSSFRRGCMTPWVNCCARRRQRLGRRQVLRWRWRRVSSQLGARGGLDVIRHRVRKRSDVLEKHWVRGSGLAADVKPDKKTVWKVDAPTHLETQTICAIHGTS